MLKNKPLIEETIQGRPVKVSVRSIACKRDSWSKFHELNEASRKFIYNTNLIDGIKVQINYTTVTFNARHNLF